MTARMATGSVEMSERVLTDSRKRPTKALAEAIWNALDVGADHVNVDFEFTELEAVKTIIVVDDGEGMSLEQARQGFGEYGDSWKRRIDARTHNGRSIHGQRGQGRYDILHLGSRPSGHRWPPRSTDASALSRSTYTGPTRGRTTTRGQHRMGVLPAPRCG
jgi:hypothetical protein